MPKAVNCDELLQRLEALRPSGRSTILVAIGGGGGAGKSTLALWLADQMDGATVVQTDDFARVGLRGWDWQYFNDSVLKPILRDESGGYQRFDWHSQELGEWHDVDPGGVLILEGVSAQRTELGNPWDASVWVETPYGLRLERGVARDGEAMRSVWVDEWLPHEERYFQDQRPHERADYIVLGYDTA